MHSSSGISKRFVNTPWNRERRLEKCGKGEQKRENTSLSVNAPGENFEHRLVVTHRVPNSGVFHTRGLEDRWAGHRCGLPSPLPLSTAILNLHIGSVSGSATIVRVAARLAYPIIVSRALFSQPPSPELEKLWTVTIPLHKLMILEGGPALCRVRGV